MKPDEDYQGADSRITLGRRLRALPSSYDRRPVTEEQHLSQRNDQSTNWYKRIKRVDRDPEQRRDSALDF